MITLNHIRGQQMTNYSKGANFERRVKRYLESCGYYVVRSAGSHGVLDLVGFMYIAGQSVFNVNTDVRHLK